MTFKQATWINNTDVYEVNIRQYTADGTFNAFAKELPRLKDMGVSTLWFMPVTPIAQKNKKGTLGSPYACSDYTAVNPEFGDLNDFKKLVKLAHSMNFKVIIDWVANHTGWDHVWTKSHPEYYKTDSNTNDFKMASGMDDIIELDYDNPDLRKAMIDAMLFWVKECAIDGFRCDLAFWVTLDFWLQARTELEKTKTLFWLAESDPLEHPDYYQAFDACYTWTWMHKTEDFYKKDQNVHQLHNILKQYNSVNNAPGIPLWFTANHDENTWNGTEYEKYGEAAKALAVLSFTRNGLPLIYSGQELPNLKRLQFFDKDTIEWNGNYAMQDFYKTLLYLHKNNPALRTGDAAATSFDLINNTPDNVITYLRKNGNKAVFVLINMSNQNIRCTINDEHLTGKFMDVFHQVAVDFTTEKDFDLYPWQYLVYEK